MAIELTDAQEKQWNEYRGLGTPDEIRRKRSDLETDNSKQRDKIREAHGETDRVTTELRDARKTVPDGGQVLTADDAKAFKAYQELGKPDDLKKTVEQKAELEAKVSRSEWAKTAADAADAHEWKPEVLQKLPGAEKLRFEVKEETVDGEKVKVAYVTTDQQGATPQKLADYAAANWKEFLPALESEDASDTRDGASDDQETRRMVRQAPKGRGAAKGAAPVEKAKEAKRGSRRYSSL